MYALCLGFGFKVEGAFFGCPSPALRNSKLWTCIPSTFLHAPQKYWLISCSSPIISTCQALLELVFNCMQIGGRKRTFGSAHDFLWKRMNDSEIEKGFSNRVVVPWHLQH